MFGKVCHSSLCFKTHIIYCLSLACAKCNESGIKIIRPPQNMTTVSRQRVQLNCLILGNLCSLDPSLSHNWEVEFPPSQKREPFYIYNSTHLYQIAIDSYCCNYTSVLTIPSIPPEWSGAIKMTCVERLEAIITPVIQRSTSMLSK